MEYNYLALGARIRQEREKLGWTQAALAERAKMSDSHLSAIERGHTELSVKYLVNIVNALNISINEILSDEICTTDISVGLIEDIIKDCSPIELKMMAECLRSLKKTFKKYNVTITPTDV